VYERAGAATSAPGRALSHGLVLNLHKYVACYTHLTPKQVPLNPIAPHAAHLAVLTINRCTTGCRCRGLGICLQYASKPTMHLTWVKSRIAHAQARHHAQAIEHTCRLAPTRLICIIIPMYSHVRPHASLHHASTTLVLAGSPWALVWHGVGAWEVAWPVRIVYYLIFPRGLAPKGAFCAQCLAWARASCYCPQIHTHQARKPWGRA
jgi:hypothetical protein